MVLEEATDSYEREGVVQAMRSDSLEDMERNVEAVRAWYAARTAGAAPAPA